MAKKKPIVSPLGQWAYPGEVTIIPSNSITMKGVNYPVLGIDNLGNQKVMMPGVDYTFPGDYVTEIPQMGKGGLTQWFAEKWTDIKTGKPCGRSGKEKGSRPYPACRPKNRVNETTPKTTSEMSSAEKARFKREKTSGKRIDYNHKRRQDGGENWLDSYQDGGLYAVGPYDEMFAPKQGNYLLPDINRPSYIDEFGGRRSEYKMGVNIDGKEILIPTVVGGKQLSEDQALDRYRKTGLHMGQFNTPEEADYASRLRTARYNMLEDPIRFQADQFQTGGMLPPIYTSNFNDPRIGRYNDSLDLYNKNTLGAYNLLRKYPAFKLPKVESKLNSDSEYLFRAPYSVATEKYIDYGDHTIRNTAKGIRKNNGNINDIRNYDFVGSHALEWESDNTKNKIKPIGYQLVPETNEKYIDSGDYSNSFPVYKKPVQPIIYKPSLAISNIDRDMYTPGGGMGREYNIGVTLQDGSKKAFRTEKEYQDWKEANNLDISNAKVTEGKGYSYNYPENKKYGGWLDQFQTGGYRYIPPSQRALTFQSSNPSTTDNTRANIIDPAVKKAAEAAQYARRVGSISQGTPKSNYQKAKEASSFVSQAEQRKGSADPLDYVLDVINPATYGFAGSDLVGNTAMGVNNLAKGNFSEAAGNALNAGMNALYLLPATSELRGPLNTVSNKIYRGIPKAFVNKSEAELQRQAGVDWLRNWYSQPEIKQRFNQQIYNPTVSDDLVMPIYKKNVVTDVIEKPNSTINLSKSGISDLASIMSKDKYAQLKYGFKNDPVVSLKYNKDVPAIHKNYLGVNSGYGNNMGGYTNVYPEHPSFFYSKFNPTSDWKPTVKGTTIHEGTHWLTTGDDGLAASTKEMFKEPFDFSKKINKHDTYLTKPTEVHARLNELRSQYNLGPTVTQSQVDKIVSDGLKGKTTVQKRFFELLKDNKSLTNLFNTAMSVSAPLAAASQLQENKYGGWLNKYK